MRQVGNKISYVRNPFARQSFFCLGLGILALGLGTFSIYLSLKGAGQGGLNTGAYGFSSIVAAAAGLWYGILSFTEDNCCLLYTSPSPRDRSVSRMPSSA